MNKRLNKLSFLASLAALCCGLIFVDQAIAANSAGAQQLIFSGLRSSNHAGAFNAMVRSSSGTLYLLMDQGDGVRVLEFDSTGVNVLAQAYLGAKGDIGYGLALDAAGNVFVTGTTSSGAIIGSNTAVFPNASSGNGNGFLAGFDSTLQLNFVSFLGGSGISPQAIAVNGNSVYITGIVFGSGLPVTPSAVIQNPPSGATENGFVERFTSDGSQLIYATYLGGINGFTAPAAIAADTSGNAYVGGYTEASGYPTVNALIAEMIPPEGATTGSGFLTQINPGGDALLYSTFVSGDGITNLQIDSSGTTLYLAGNISPSGFPVSNWSFPVMDANPTTVISMHADGSELNWETAVALGDFSTLSIDTQGNIWIAGEMTAPLLGATTFSEVGDAFAIRMNNLGVVDRTVRLGGIPAEHTTDSSLSLAPTAVAADSTGNLYVAGTLQPATGSSLLDSVFYDAPLLGPSDGSTTTALPSTLRNLVPSDTICTNSSACIGSGGYLAEISSTDGASLVVSTDTLPNLTVRNLGSATASNVSINISGYSFTSNCASTIAPGAECSIALTGSGPGSLQLSSASIAAPLQIPLTANTSATPSDALAISPREIDFGMVSAADNGASAVVTVTNLTGIAQNFSSALDNGVSGALNNSTSASNFTQSGTTCNVINSSTLMVAANSSCSITLTFTASSNSTNDGNKASAWSINGRDIALTAYSVASPISYSSSEIDFGTQYAGGTRLPRFLYLQNVSTAATSHALLSLPQDSPFSVNDGCPASLEPGMSCAVQFDYNSTRIPSDDSVTITLDNGATLLLTGKSVPQPGTVGNGVNPFLNVTPLAINFYDPVLVTEVSAVSEQVQISNDGNSAFPIALTINGDFTFTSNCPSTLAAHGSCTASISLAPSQAGQRTGILSVTAGSSTPIYVSLSGTGTGITSATNNSVEFGEVPVGETSVEWVEITQDLGTVSATASANYSVVLVQDDGYGHGSPSLQTYSSNASGMCNTCWLGILFSPTNPGTDLGAVAVSSAIGGSANTINLRGTGVVLTSPYINPAVTDFGTVNVNSSSAGEYFTLTNGATQPLSLGSPVLSSGYQLLSTTCGNTLAAGDSCLLQARFSPTVTGNVPGTLSINVGGNPVTASLSGYGADDPGVAFSPDALNFNTLPGSNATSQFILVSNTGSSTLQIGVPSVATTSFSATSNCGTLAPAATCNIQVVFAPSTSTVTDTLTIPVNDGSSISNYAIPLNGDFVAASSGLVITPASLDFGSASTGSAGISRLMTVANLSSATTTLTLSMPQQFALASQPCTTLAANSSCQFAVDFMPLNNGPITGTVQVNGNSNGSTTYAIAYLQGVGNGTGVIGYSNSVSNGVLDFGLVQSGQSATQTIVLTNLGATVANIHKITTQWPFSSSTNCTAPLAVNTNCTVTITFSPTDEFQAEANPPSPLTQAGTLIIESDSLSAPDVIELAGVVDPIANASPNNTGTSSHLVASTGSLVFTSTAVGDTSAPQNVTLTNNGTATANINALLPGTGFTVDNGNCIGALPSNTSCTFSVAFAPSSLGQQMTAVEILSTASSSMDFISVTGLAQTSQLQITPASLNYGGVLVGSTAHLPVVITNTGAGNITLNGITVGSGFSLSGNCISAGSVIAAGASCDITVTFAPTIAGAANGQISIPNSATTSPLTVSLSGIGQIATLSASPLDFNFGTVLVGQTSVLPLTLQNTGTGTLSGITASISGDYSFNTNCGVTLNAGSACTMNISFSPTTYGYRSGSLILSSNDPNSPLTIPLSGYGQQVGGFSLNIAAGSSAIQAVNSGMTANYALTTSAFGGFQGVVVLSCSPQQSVPNAACSILPSSVALNNNSVSSNVTVTTMIVSDNKMPPFGNRRNIVMCVLMPSFFLLFLWRRRTSLPRLLILLLSLIFGLSGLQGCGGNKNDVHVTPVGSYSYLITAESTSGQVPPQSVLLQLNVQ